MLPLRDEAATALGGLVSALLGGRANVSRTHEVLVHSPNSVLNGGNSLAKAASMSELVSEEKFGLSDNQESIIPKFVFSQFAILAVKLECL